MMKASDPTKMVFLPGPTLLALSGTATYENKLASEPCRICSYAQLSFTCSIFFYFLLGLTSNTLSVLTFASLQILFLEKLRGIYVVPGLEP